MNGENGVIEILEPLTESVMDSHERRLGKVEQEFRQVVGLNGKGDEPGELAWFEVATAFNEMWIEITRAAFWAGVTFGLAGGEVKVE